MLYWLKFDALMFSSSNIITTTMYIRMINGSENLIRILKQVCSLHDTLIAAIT